MFFILGWAFVSLVLSVTLALMLESELPPGV